MLKDKWTVIIVGIAIFICFMAYFEQSSSKSQNSYKKQSTTIQKSYSTPNNSQSSSGMPELDALRQTNKTMQESLKKMDQMSPEELDRFMKQQKAVSGYYDAQKQQVDNRSREVDYSSQERLKAEERAIRNHMANNPVQGYSLP